MHFPLAESLRNPKATLAVTQESDDAEPDKNESAA